MMPFKRLVPYAVIFLCIQLALRLSLLGRALTEVDFEIPVLFGVFAYGVWFDLVTLSFVMLPVLLYAVLLPQRWYGSRFDRRFDAGFRFVFTFIVLFDAVAEHLFWTEFTTRLNFIAVDYLIYTQEVIGNIMESYPVHWLLAAIGLVAVLVSWVSLKKFPLVTQGLGWRKRWASMAILGAACFGLYTMSSTDQAQFSDHAEANELAASGIYNLFSAAWNNEIDFNRFYAHNKESDVYNVTRALLAEKGEVFVHNDGKDLTRLIQHKGAELHKNVMLVVMESLSADYMGSFGNEQNLTPNLDRLGKEGLFFTQLFATGTRTVRGLEAVALSIPPTPGQSILRRPDNGNLFSLGFIFQDRGYDTKFIYGGYGYFDNMNAFFSGNGFSIVDRNTMSGKEVQFANVWGVCDEDMFARAIREADASYANGKPFMHVVMTTSNHRPFTYPQGRIEIESRTGRLGGVKYADYSVGKLVEDSRNKPWFKDTVFVFIADHTAGAGGKAELDPHKYHIPLIFYAPGFIKPAQYTQLASQIDMAPVLLGMLNFSYYSKFFGEDVLRNKDVKPRAFISNFQKVALVQDNELTVLAPKRKVEQYSWPQMQSFSNNTDTKIADTISYYQSASWWKERYRRIPTMGDEKLAQVPAHLAH